ncbi:TPA: hypothetical protein KD877_004222 [Vibrio parahaemolyticus]|nr:hypothetical protein [Vibrio parahaemolyticus]
MKRKIIAALFFGLFSLKSFSAETFDLTPYWSISKGAMKSRGNLCGGWYDLTGNYICPNGLSLNNGQSVVATHDVNIHVYGGVELKGNNEIGDPVNSINIFSKNSDVKGQNDIEIFGHVESFGAVDLKNDIEIHGLISVSHGKVYLEDAHIKGSVTSESDTVEIKGNTNLIEGNIWGAKDIVLSKVTVKGGVTSSAGQIKTEVNSNIIEGDVVAHGDVVLKHTVVRGDVTSKGGAVKTENLNNQVYGDIEALHEVVLKGTKVVGDIQSLGEEIKLEEAGGGNSVYGNLIALHQVEIKKSLVCGQVTSRGSEVKLENSKENKNRGIYAYTNAIQASHKATVKNSSVCGSVVGHSYDFDNEKIYCGADEPNCDNSQAIGSCPLDVLEDVCPDMVPEIIIPEPVECLAENFDAEKPLSNWTVMGRGKSTVPYVDSGRFVVSTNQNDQSTASAFKITIPSEDNVVQVTFDHYARRSSTRTGGDGIAIVLSDANVPPSPGALGGPLGYGVKPGMEGFAGGWVAFGIDEYGNFSNEGSFDDYETRPGRKPHSVTIRGAGYQKVINGSDTNEWFGGYKFIKNNTDLGPLDEKGGRSPSDKHRFRVTVDTRKDIIGRSSGVWVSIERSINGFAWESLIKPLNIADGFGQPQLPKDFLVSITSGTGASTNIHEVDNVKICADRFNKEPQIDHFRFTYDGSGNVCDAKSVTLTACMNPACDETYPPKGMTNAKELEVTLSDMRDAQWLNSQGEPLANNTLIFTHSANLQVRSEGAEQAKLGIARTSIISPNIEPVKCKLFGEDDFDPSCLISFASSITLSIPDKISGLPFFSQSGDLQTQYKLKSPSANYHPNLMLCESSSSQIPSQGLFRNIQMKFDYDEPSKPSYTPALKVSFKGKNSQFEQAFSMTKPNEWVTIPNVFFSKDGKAVFNVEYPEVGRLKVSARVLTETNKTQAESYRTFVSFPAKLGLSVSGGGDCSDGCDGYIPAGEEFTMSVKAYQDGGDEAKNYQEPDVKITNTLVYPDPDKLDKGSVVDATLLVDTLPDDTVWSGGSVSFKQSVSDVGVFKFVVSAPLAGNGDSYSSYLGSAAFKITDATLNVGRFYPGKFNVYSSDQTTLYNNIWDYPNGQTFAYMGQPFGLKRFYVEALSKGGGALRNYAYFGEDYHAKFNLYENNSANDRRFSAPVEYTGNWLNGSKGPYVSGQSVGKYSASGLVWSKVVTQPDGPLNYLEKSSDTSISIAQSSSSVDKAGVSIGVKQLRKQPDIRFGRVDLDDVGGRQSETLHIPLRVEYWNDNLKRFVRNVDDDRTVIYSELDGKPKTIWPDDKSGCSILLEGNDTVTDGVTWDLSARQDPNTCNPVGRQQSRLWLQLKGGSNNLPWLKYDWDNDGEEENPSSVITFGIHRGNDRVIYRGEPGLTGQ